MGLFTPIWMKEFYGVSENTRNKRAKAKAAVEKMSDPAKLKQAALLAPDEEVAKAACGRIDDDETLAEIAMRAKTRGASDFAARRIKDQALLRKVALEAEPRKGGPTAASRIADQEALGEVACNAADYYTREKAFELIKDLGAVMNLIRTGNDVRLFLLADRVQGDENLREVLFERFHPEAVAYDRDLSTHEKEEIFKAIAVAAGKLREPEDIERALEVFGPRCAAGYYAEPVAKVVERRKASLEAKRLSGQLVLVCKTCGGVVHYIEDYDTEDGNWAKMCWFTCGCNLVGGGPRNNGDYDKPSNVEMAARAGRFEGKVIHLCPTCLGLAGSSPNACRIPACRCREKQRDPLVVPFSPAEW